MVGTRHSSYSSKTWLEAVNNLRGGANISSAFLSRPEYYNRIRERDQRGLLHESIRLYEYEGQYYIVEGNNRLISMKLRYFLEKHIGNIEDLDEKYSFYAIVSSLPYNKELLNIITTLNQEFSEQIYIKNNGKNNKEISYEIMIFGMNNDENLEITSVEDFRLFFNKHVIEAANSRDTLLGKFKI